MIPDHNKKNINIYIINCLFLNMEEREHILDILKETKKSLKNKDYIKVKNLSNEVIHNSSLNQDPDVIAVAVILYSLSKLIERMDQNQEIFEKIVEDKAFGGLVRDWMLKKVYARLQEVCITPPQASGNIGRDNLER